MTPTIQLLFLATFAFICLKPGEALICRECKAIGPGAPCIPKATCVANPETQECIAHSFIYNGQVHRKTLGCSFRGIGTCGATNGVGMRLECCDSEDFCNESL